MLVRQLAVASFLASLLAACGGVSTADSGDAGTTDGGGDSAPVVLQPPKVHRPVATTCGHDRLPGLMSDAGSPFADAGIPNVCSSDADCTQGTNGRCARAGGNAAIDLCTYDQCFADGDCAAGSVCECGATNATSGGRFDANRCVKGNCTTDGTCGANGFCSPTSTPGGCSGTEIDGYYCHSSADQCDNDSDCGTSPFAHCAFDTTQAHFVCSMVTPCNG